MNCECIYYSKGAKIEDYETLAQKINADAKAYEYEIYPVAISRMDEKVCVCDDVNGWSDFRNIPKYSAVLFVQGKLHYMDDYRIGHRVFKALHPMETPIFTDIKEFDD